MAITIVVSMFGIASAPSRAAIVPAWVDEASMGEARTLAVVVADENGLVYVMSGSIADAYDAPTVHANSYDPDTGDWTSLAPIPTGARGASGVVGPDGRVYVFSGYNDTLGVYLPDTQIYDPTANSWSSGTDIPTAIFGGKAAVGYDGLIYVMGGDTSVGTTTAVQVYDPVADLWSAGSAMPWERYHGVALSWDDYLFYIGGLDDTATKQSTAMYYSIAGDYWGTIPDIPVAVYGAAGGVGVDGLLYVFGGDLPSATGYAFDFVVYEWVALPVMSTEAIWLGGVSLPDGRLLALGGYDWSVTFARVESLNIADVTVTANPVAVSPGDAVGVTVDMDFAYLEQQDVVVVVYLTDALGVAYNPQELYFPSLTPFMFEITVPETLAAGAYSLMVEARFTSYSWVLADVEIPMSVVDVLSIDEQLALLEANITAIQMAMIAAMAETNASTMAFLQTQLDALSVALATIGAVQMLMIEAMEDANESTMAYLEEQLAILQGVLAQLGAGLTDIGAGLELMGDGQTAAMEDLNEVLADLQLQLDDFQEQIDRVENKADTAGTYGMVTMVLVIIIVILVALMVMMARKKP